MYALDLKTGTLKWKFEATGEIKSSLSVSPNDTYVAFGTFNREFIVLDAKTGQIINRFETLEGNYSTPCWVSNDGIICSSLDKNIYRFSLSFKLPVWILRTNARVFSDPLLHKGKIYIGNNSGKLYVIDPQTGKEISYTIFSERITNKVVIDEKKERLYVVTLANQIISLKVKEEFKKTFLI